MIYTKKKTNENISYINRGRTQVVVMKAIQRNDQQSQEEKNLPPHNRAEKARGSREKK
jgi:hypothetical protein